MPIYEYECEAEHRHEEVRDVESRRDPATCPACGTPAALVPSLPGRHIWDEYAARDIECKAASKSVHRGVMPDGTPYETIGGPPPQAMIDQHS